MLTVTILGSGNLATHLFKALNASEEVIINQWYSRNPKTIKAFEKTVNIISDINDLEEADVYFTAISDDAIAAFTEKLPFKDRLVVHCSGNVPMSALSPKNKRGVFYPLQTFSKERATDFNVIPICIEAEDQEHLILLKKIGSKISSTVHEINTEQRKALHLAAVFINNFVNHLYHIGHEICDVNQVPFHILKPIIEETTKKIMDLNPIDAQTGPAKRNDRNTIENHINNLEQHLPDYTAIYKTLTSSILNTYGREKL
ncbi:DUF2520 domain-containing protein [Flavobacteriaceae bacterium R38]|nr:DUF2520 domain-containing protein [Flavobacteriaceae bacterium R38]